MTSSTGSSRPTRSFKRLKRASRNVITLALPPRRTIATIRHDKGRTLAVQLYAWRLSPDPVVASRRQGLERALDALLAEDRAETVTCHRVITVMLYLIRRLQKRRR